MNLITFPVMIEYVVETAHESLDLDHRCQGARALLRPAPSQGANA